MDKRTLTLDEAARVLGVARSLAYQAARNGQLPCIRLGRRYLVLRVELERLLGERIDLAQHGEGDADAAG